MGGISPINYSKAIAPVRKGKQYRSIVTDVDTGEDEVYSVEACGGHLVCESVPDHLIDAVVAAINSCKELGGVE